MLKATRFVLLSAITITLALSRAGAAEDGPAMVQRAKNAVALIVLPYGAGYGTAFRVDESGFFLTHAKNVLDLRDGTIELVLQSADARQGRIRASLSRLNRNTGLALLRAETKGAGPALTPAEDPPLVETTQLIVLGYPAADPPVAPNSPNPSLCATVVRIQSLRKTAGRCTAIQIDPKVNAGHCGGPVLDSSGNLVGMMDVGLRSSGSNLVIPASQLRSFLGAPEIVFSPPQVPWARRSEELEIPLRIAAFGQMPRPQVELAVGSGKDERTYRAELDSKGTCIFRVAPLPPRARPARVPVTIEYPEGRIQCSVFDEALQLDGRPFKLSEISQIERKAGQTIVTAVDGAQTTGAVLTLPALKADFGGYALEVDTFRARRIANDAQEEPLDSVNYTLLVKRSNGVVAQQKGTIALVGRPRPKPRPLSATLPTTVPTTQPKAPATVFELESGPAAMHVTEDGLLTWRLPKNVTGRLPLVVRITDPSGRRTTQRLEISSPDQPPATRPADISTTQPALPRIVALSIEEAKGLSIHMLPRGVIASAEPDPEFNLPRAGAPRPQAPPGPHSPAWAMVRIINHSTRDIAALRLSVRSSGPGATDQIQGIDALSGRGPLSSGGTCAAALDFTGIPARIAVKVTLLQYAN